MRFADLLKYGPGRTPAEQQAWARKWFPQVVKERNLGLWKPGDPVCNEGARYLIGVAPGYDGISLALLDAIAVRTTGQEVLIEVFDTEDCRSQEDLERYIPGVGPAFQDPVIGIWERGVLVYRGWGKEAVDEICKRLEVKPDTLSLPPGHVGYWFKRGPAG